MTPLNIYLQHRPTPNSSTRSMNTGSDQGLARANIFPATCCTEFWRHAPGSVVFYDYDEIEYMTDCNSAACRRQRRGKTKCRPSRGIRSAGTISSRTVATFPARRPAHPRRAAQRHADLFDPALAGAQGARAIGVMENVFPYPGRIGLARDLELILTGGRCVGGSSAGHGPGYSNGPDNPRPRQLSA